MSDEIKVKVDRVYSNGETINPWCYEPVIKLVAIEPSRKAVFMARLNDLKSIFYLAMCFLSFSLAFSLMFSMINM